MSQFPKISADTPTGGHVSIVAYGEGDNNIGGGAKNLGQAEMNAYRKAKKLMAEGKKGEAEGVLRAAGFIL